MLEAPMRKKVRQCRQKSRSFLKKKSEKNCQLPKLSPEPKSILGEGIKMLFSRSAR
jgi:hypothetical protein